MTNKTDSMGEVMEVHQCPVCDVLYESEDNFSKHMLNEHGLLPKKGER